MRIRKEGGPGFMVDGMLCWVGVGYEEDEVNLRALGGSKTFEDGADGEGYVLNSRSGDGCNAETEGRGGRWSGGRCGVLCF